MFILPDSDAYIRSGLAKSAFKSSIYGGLPLDFYLPGIETVSTLVRRDRVSVKFYMLHDAYLAFYRPYENVVASLKQKNKAAPAWTAYVRGLTVTDEFHNLNKITANSQELAAAAAALLLTTIAKTEMSVGSNAKRRVTELDDLARDVASGKTPQDVKQEVDAEGADKYLKWLEKATEGFGKSATGLLDAIARSLLDYLDAKVDTEAAVSAMAGGGSGGTGYALEALSIWTFLGNPVEFRKRVQLLRNAHRMFRQFMSMSTTFDKQQQASLHGGVAGVTLMRDVAQLRDLLPSEAALARAARALFAAKLARRQLLVHERAVTLRPAVFVDKSGSMGDRMSGGIEKISAAAGLALALYKRFGGLIYLFDTEVEQVSPKDVIKTLLTINAYGGTNIDPVIQEILRLGRNYIHIIISDGITEASEELLRQFVASGLADRTRLILIPPAGDNYRWVALLKQRGHVYHANEVASFVNAAREALS